MLLLLAGAAAFGAALAAGKTMGGGPLRTFIAVLIGVVIATACGYAPRLLRSRVVLRWNPTTTVSLVIIYVGAFLWVGVSWLLSLEITRGGIRLVVH